MNIIIGLDSVTGSSIWQISGTGYGEGENFVQGEILYRGTKGVATIQSYRIENGELIWQTRLPWAQSVTDIFHFENRIFAHTSDNEFFILDEQGKILDNFQVTSRVFLQIGNTLNMEDVQGIKAIDFLSKNELWLVETERRYTHAPIFDNGTIFLRTSLNPAYIYSVDQSTGDVHWIISQDALSNLYIMSERIYFISSSGYLVTLNRNTGEEISKVKFSPSFDLDKQIGGYFITGDSTSNVLVVSFGDNTQIMGIKVLNP